MPGAIVFAVAGTPISKSEGWWTTWSIPARPAATSTLASCLSQIEALGDGPAFNALKVDLILGQVGQSARRLAMLWHVSPHSPIKRLSRSRCDRTVACAGQVELGLTEVARSLARAVW